MVGLGSLLVGTAQPVFRAGKPGDKEQGEWRFKVRAVGLDEATVKEKRSSEL